jgi:hypothetical protein
MRWAFGMDCHGRFAIACPAVRWPEVRVLRAVRELVHSEPCRVGQFWH